MERGLYTVFVPNRRCNLRCSYCGTDTSQFLENNSDFEPGHLSEILERSRNLIDTKILKIVGGGEVFLIDAVEGWVAEQAPHYETVLVLTNGVDVRENQIEALSDIPNIHFGLSLDGHTFGMNQYRFKSEKTFARVLTTFHRFSRARAPLQINMVLHDLNCSQFLDYLKFLTDTNDQLTLHISPLMDKSQTEAKRIAQTRAWIEQLDALLEHYDSFSTILLPRSFYERLTQYLMDNNVRSHRCYIPFFMLQLFGTGDLTACPIVWNASLGNVTAGINSELGSFGLYKNKMYSILNQPRPRVPFCKPCFSSYDIFNLYVEDLIGIEEMRQIPLFSRPGIHSRLEDIKQTLLSSGETRHEH